MELLTSATNPRVKMWASLKEKKFREATGLYLVEGLRSVTAYVDAGAVIDALLFDSFGSKPDAILELAERCENMGITAFELAEQALARVADTEHPQGVIAVVRVPHFDGAEVLTGKESASAAEHLGDTSLGCDDVVLVADGIRDPGNLGTMLRSAEAVAARAIIVTSGSVDPFNPKVVRASMGALAHVRIVQLAVTETAELLAREGYRVIATDAHHGTALYDANLRGRVAVVVGSEAEGVSPALRAAAADTVSLPMPGATESLNAGVTSAVVLYEALRQRK